MEGGICTDLYAKSFTFNGTCSADYGLELVTVDGSADIQRETGITYETQKSDATFYRDKTNFYGRRYSDTLKFTVNLVKRDQEKFSDTEYREIVQWITSPKTPTLFTVEDCDGDTYHKGLEYFAVCNKFSEINVGDVVGLSFDFECDKAYPTTAEQTFSVAAPNILTIDNTSDDLNEDYYPVIVLGSTKSGKQTVQIKNNRYPNDVLEVSILAGQEIVIDNENGDITDSLDMFNYGTDTNLKWIRLAPGINTLDITGEVNVDVKCRFVRKRGI